MPLPLFPLQSVLFPGALLHLQIFEVRYLDMIGRCHKQGTPFGVVCLTQGSEVRRRQPRGNGAAPSGADFVEEAFHNVGTLATITELERPQPGLLVVRATGTQRFRITTSERLKHGLWMAEVELLPGDAKVGVPLHLDFARRGLQHLLDKIRMHGAEVPIEEPFQWHDCGWLANRWCELLPLSPDAKQRFMALDNPMVRLELVVDTLHQIGFKLPADPAAAAPPA